MVGTRVAILLTSTDSSDQLYSTHTESLLVEHNSTSLLLYHLPNSSHLLHSNIVAWSLRRVCVSNKDLHICKSQKNYTVLPDTRDWTLRWPLLCCVVGGHLTLSRPLSSLSVGGAGQSSISLHCSDGEVFSLLHDNINTWKFYIIYCIICWL